MDNRPNGWAKSTSLRLSIGPLVKFLKFGRSKLRHLDRRAGFGVSEFNRSLASKSFSIVSCPRLDDRAICRQLQVVLLLVHSGFGPSNWPITTNFVGENFRRRDLFFGKSQGKALIKNPSSFYY